MRQKQDTLDFYVIVRALLVSAVPGTPVSARRRRIAGEDRRVRAGVVEHDAGVDPSTVSWEQLPCIGSSPVDCEVHMAMARAAVGGR